MAYSEVLANELATAAVGFLKRARAWYAARGIQIESVMTHNGSTYRSQAWRATLRAAGLRHLLTRPHARPLGPYLRYYNLERVHTALGHRPPLARLASVNDLLVINN